MDPCGTRCSAWKTKQSTWEQVKNQYEDRTAMLQAKEQELRLKITQMESLLSNRASESCCCAAQVPKVFPNKQDSPVRDIPKFRDACRESCAAIHSSVTQRVACRPKSPPSQHSTSSRRSTPIQSPSQSPSRSVSPKKQPNCPTFFQKVMENAKSILTLKCSAGLPSLDEQPTRENDEVAFASNLKQKKSCCSCEYDEEITRIDCTESSYSQDATNSFCCKTCPHDSTSSIKSKKTASAVVNTYNSYCSTSTCTELKASVDDGSQYVRSESSGHTQTCTGDGPLVCPTAKIVKCQAVGGNVPKKQSCGSNKTCASYLSIRRRGSTPNVSFKENEAVKKQRSKSQIKEVDIQCAFIGSPMLTPADVPPSKVIVPQVSQDGDKPCQCSNRNPPQKQCIPTTPDMIPSGQGSKGQIEGHRSNEKDCSAFINSYQNIVSSSVPSCCCAQPKGQFDRIDKISQELKLENKVLKDELMQMKLEMKHCLEKIEGPIKSQLQTEKMKCVQLEQELNYASQNIMLNQDAHAREMNALKLQLCMACSNISELNSMNRRLKGEMASLDGMCMKLEDDLLKQKMNEAETIKLLTKRRTDPYEGTCTCSKTGVQEKFSCDCNLHLIARKLSKTLKDSEPCELCARLPAELTGAAKCIKDLSDLVDSHKVKRMDSEEAPKTSHEIVMKPATSQAPPETMDEESQCMEGQRGDEARTTTVIAPVRIEDRLSSELVVKISSMEPAPSDFKEKPPAESTYFSAAGEPMAMCADICGRPCSPTCETDKPCVKQGKPCWEALVSREEAKEKIEKPRRAPMEKVKEEPKREPKEEPKGEPIGEPTEEPKEKPREEPKEEPKEEAKKMSVEAPPSTTLAASVSEVIQKEKAPPPSPAAPLQHLETWVPPPCLASCGSDEPCAKGQPCYIIKGRGDEPQGIFKEPEAVAEAKSPRAGSIIQPIYSEIVDGVIKSKFPSDAIIEPPDQVPSVEAKKPPSKEKDILERSLVIERPAEEPMAPAISETEKLLDQVPVEAKKPTSEEKVIFEESLTVEKSLVPEEFVATEESVGIEKSATVEEPTEKVTVADAVPTTVEPSDQVPVEDIKHVYDEKDITSQEYIITEDTVVPTTVTDITPGTIAGDQEISFLTTEPTTEAEPTLLSSEPKTPEADKEIPEIGEGVDVEETIIPRFQAPLSSAPIAVFTPELDDFVVVDAIDLGGLPPESTVRQKRSLSVTLTTPKESSIPVRARALSEPSVQPSIVSKPSVKEDVEVAEKPRIPSKGSVTEEPSVVQPSAIKKLSPATSGAVRGPTGVIEPIAEEPFEPTEAAPAAPGGLRTPVVSSTLPPLRPILSSTSELPYTEERIGNFPFEVETKVEILDVPPPDLHVTTTITASGTLEVITEGPEGLIETTLNYMPDGTIEVVTHLTELETSKEPDDRPSTVKIAPTTPMVFGSPQKGLYQSAVGDSFMSGATDLTGLETVTESTKETISCSYTSDYDKTMAGDETIADSTGITAAEVAPSEREGMIAGTSSKATSSIREQDTSIIEEEPSRKVEEGVSTIEGYEGEEYRRKEEQGVSTIEDETGQVTGISTKEYSEQGIETEGADVPGQVPLSAIKSEFAPGTPEVTETGEVIEGKPRIAGDVDKTAQQALTGQKRDCGCQATPRAEQSCQCCECKDVGVSTSRDSETLTEDNMVKPEPLEQIPELTEFEQSTTVPTDVSRTSRDFAEAVEAESGQIQGTADEISTLHDGPSSTQDRQEYINKKGKSVQDRDTECACSDELDEEGENVSTADRAAQCECFGPIERDDRSEGRLSSGSETDHETPGKKKPGQDDHPKKKPSSKSDSKTKKPVPSIERATSKGDGSHEKISYVESDIKKEKFKPGKSERDDFDGEGVKQDRSTYPHPKSSDKKEKSKRKVDERDVYDKEKTPYPEFIVGETESFEDTGPSEPKSRKKRSAPEKVESVECDCPGVCQCVICSPKIIAQRKACLPPLADDKGRPCWCTPQPMTPLDGPMARSHVPTAQIPTPQSAVNDPRQARNRQHPAGCQCVNCLCEPCTPCPPQYGQEAFLRSTNLTSSQAVPSTDRKGISVNDVFKSPEQIYEECKMRSECKKSRGNAHPPNCECVDCLCLPDIRKIAELKEHPIIRDEKQVYQVKCYCENTRKPLAGSKIPIATNSTTGPPKAKSTVSCTCDDCKCSPCSDINKSISKSSSSQKPVQAGAAADSSARMDSGTRQGLKMTPSELAKLCDCQECQCAVCFNKPAKQEGNNAVSPDIGDTSKIKGSNKNCCCKGACTCEVCPVEQLAKQAMAAGKPVSSPASVPAASLKPVGAPLFDHPEDCDCADCFCPHSKARNGSEYSLDQPEDCDCAECICPHAKSRMGKADSKTKIKGSGSKLPVKVTKPSVPVKASSIRPQGCTCGECVCPGKDAALQATGDQSQILSDCHCPICSCPGKELAIQSLSPPAQDQAPSMPGIPSKPGIASMPAIPEGTSIADCDCIDCQCNPCADPKRRKPEAVTPCDCPDCVCDPCADPTKRRDKGDTREGTIKGERGIMVAPSEVVPPTSSAGVGSTENRSTHPPDCICDDCLCQPEEKHESGCTCPECKCVDCYAQRITTEVHAEGCRCIECLCAPCNKKDVAGTAPKQFVETGSGEAKPAEATDSCTCTICKCVDCFHKPRKAHAKECTCADCICIDCQDKTKTGKVVKTAEEPKGSSPPPTVQPAPITHPCHCIKCTCDICTSTAASKDGSPKGCTCEICQCSDCGGMRSAPATAGKECTCVTCQCDDCQSKKKEGLIVPAARGDEPRAMPHGEGCNCDICLCSELEMPASSLVQEVKAEVAQQTIAVGTVASPFMDPPPFEVPIRKPCTCGRCECLECNKGDRLTPGGDPVKQRVAAGRSVGVVPPSTAEAPPFEVPVHIPCTCGKCDCLDCNKQAGIAPPTISPPTTSFGIQPTVSFAPPGKTDTTQTTAEQLIQTTLPTSTSFATTTSKTEAPKLCICQECDCTECNKMGGPVPTTISFPQSTLQASTSFPSSATGTLPTTKSTTTKCDCPTCTCPEDAFKAVAISTTATAVEAVASKLVTQATAKSTMTNCDCATCTCPEDLLKEAAVSASPPPPSSPSPPSSSPPYSSPSPPSSSPSPRPVTEFPAVTSKSTGLLNKEPVQEHPKGCICPECCACEVKLKDRQAKKEEKIVNEEIINEEIINISKMDNETLRKKIQTDKQENCKCKEQIKEIRRALDKIKCSCTEAEMKAIKSTGGGKPFVKQASAFGQTMSGLKFALNNLQEKCKAKDKMIEVMTGELKMRTSSNTFDKVLNTNGITDVPDYDKADDVKSLDRPPDNTTNILFAVNEEREIGHTSVRQKSSEHSGHKHKKRSKVCKCGKQHKDKDNSNVDLSGFEVVDIRRITQDSIIIKWRPPQSSLINGYDIFVNGVNKSKVMSGGRTSAMVHSLDLSSTIQITIYAVTKCGRCEPPAIAIYEINA